MILVRLAYRLNRLLGDGVTGFHVPNGDHVALASTLARLLQDDDLRRKLGQQAQGWAQHYSWAKIGGRVTDVYRLAQEPQCMCVVA